MSMTCKKEKALFKAEDIYLSSIIGSPKDVKRALYWKIHHDSLASSEDVKRASYILENFSEYGVNSGDEDFVMDQVKQWTIDELSKSGSDD
jgi:hypothetical protein